MDEDVDKESPLELATKQTVVAALEFFLSYALVESFFECPDPSRRDDEELKYLYYMAWVPGICGLVLGFGHWVLPACAPAPDNFDAHVRHGKIFWWVLSFVFLVVDKRMVLKRGPALQLAIVFSACDVLRYEMEVKNLIEDEEEELGGDHEPVESDERDDHAVPAGPMADPSIPVKALQHMNSNSDSHRDTVPMVNDVDHRELMHGYEPPTSTYDTNQPPNQQPAPYQGRPNKSFVYEL
ncbi:TPA: hypothetical protein N0F65_007939 [Lagenidium giganteum]|uniref:Uncharacterized protein n=1 Tax=Lagenidium giganteum TaxID=4803 RepID=A0AAV2YJI3_9STRA|nr:TPA: hypothetical protein N0F65_007939 [Lagenidium giganteum]